MLQKKFLFILTLTLVLGMITPIFQVRGGPPFPGGEGEPCDCESAEDCCEAGLACFCDPISGDGNPEGTCLSKGSIVFCPPTKYKEILDLVEEIMNWVFYIAIIVAPLMIVIGAFMFMTSAGEPAKAVRAKKVIIWAGVGLAIVLFAKGLISIIEFLLI